MAYSMLMAVAFDDILAVDPDVPPVLPGHVLPPAAIEAATLGPRAVVENTPEAFVGKIDLAVEPGLQPGKFLVLDEQQDGVLLQPLVDPVQVLAHPHHFGCVLVLDIVLVGITEDNDLLAWIVPDHRHGDLVLGLNHIHELARGPHSGDAGFSFRVEPGMVLNVAVAVQVIDQLDQNRPTEKPSTVNGIDFVVIRIAGVPKIHRRIGLVGRIQIQHDGPGEIPPFAPVPLFHKTGRNDLIEYLIHCGFRFRKIAQPPHIQRSRIVQRFGFLLFGVHSLSLPGRPRGSVATSGVRPFGGCFLLTFRTRTGMFPH